MRPVDVDMRAQRFRHATVNVRGFLTRVGTLKYAGSDS